MINTDDDLAAEKMFKKIQYRVRRLDMVRLHVNASQYAEYAKMLLKSKGIVLDVGIEQPLFEYITRISVKNSFSGLESIHDSVDDIIYMIDDMTDTSKVTGKQLVKIIESLVVVDDETFTRKIGFQRS